MTTRRDNPFRIRMTKDQKRTVERMARLAGCSVSEWARRTMIEGSRLPLAERRARGWAK